MIDILAIRDQLNELPFVDGRRQVLIGQISAETGVLELAGDEVTSQNAGVVEPAAVDEFLQNLASQLRRHGLDVSRSDEDNRLYAVQSLKRDGGQDLSWMREAFQWVARLTTVGLEMAIPGLVGWWLDQRFGTRFLGLLGLAFGVALGVRQLVQIARAG